MLSPDAQVLWQQYVVAEKDRIREVMLPALDKFIEAVLKLPEETWKAWARDFADQVSVGKSGVPVRFPLFRRVLLPALAEGVLLGVPGCARSLAEFESHLVNTKNRPLPENLRTRSGLLREAVLRDPTDHLARSRLVETLASELDYSLHEVPAGVLWGHNGASPEECAELLDILNQFRAHVAALHDEKRFEDLIADCELHFNAYREYLLAGRPGGSYESFLAARARG